MLVDDIKMYFAHFISAPSINDKSKAQLEFADAIIHHAHHFTIKHNDVAAFLNYDLSNVIKLLDLVKLPYPCVTITVDEGKGCKILYATTIKEQGNIATYVLLSYNDNSLHGMYCVEFPLENIECQKNQIALTASVANICLDEGIRPATQKEGMVVIKGIYTMLATLVMINSPKCIDIKKVDQEKINKKRIKNDKKPLVSFSEIVIKQNIKQEFCDEEKTKGSKKSRHWRRGHFKRINNEMRWWSPCIVGSKDIGTVVSQYKVSV